MSTPVLYFQKYKNRQKLWYFALPCIKFLIAKNMQIGGEA